MQTQGACALPGCTVRYDTFLPVMWRAVARGFVTHADACFVNEGLRHGFKAGVVVERMSGHRWFRNYPTALDNRGAVVDATVKRLASFKSVDLGVWSGALAHTLRATFAATAICPIGAVQKNALYAPGEYRPTSDHTRTGLNAATDLGFLRHALDTYDEVAWFLRQDYFMRVSDVDAAFPMLPYHPDLWPFLMCRFFVDGSDTLHLLLHLFGDFGTAGMPGTFKKFLVDVVLGMARSEQVLTLPMLVWVDDCALVGERREAVDAEMVRFHDWAQAICGVFFKAVKDKLAAQRQLYIGFWWDSRTFTRELEERKLMQYVEMLGAFASRPTLTLHELQVVAGRMQRAIMTFPPGAACLLVSVFQLMTGLRLPWHKRRTTRRARMDFRLVADFLTLNLGRGFYSYDGFRRAPEVRTDASKSALLAAGGFVSACGAYCWWRYGSSAKRKCIDFLEGDTVVVAVRRLCSRWRQCVVPVGVDNMAFQRSAAKGRSRVDRLNDLVRELFALMVQYHFVLDFFWLSSEDNLLADDLSRDKEDAFLEHARSTGFWSEDTVPERMPGTGEKRTLPDTRGAVSAPMQSESGAYCRCLSCYTGEGYNGHCLNKRMPGNAYCFACTPPECECSCVARRDGIPDPDDTLSRCCSDPSCTSDALLTAGAGAVEPPICVPCADSPVLADLDDDICLPCADSPVRADLDDDICRCTHCFTGTAHNGYCYNKRQPNSDICFPCDDFGVGCECNCVETKRGEPVDRPCANPPAARPRILSGALAVLMLLGMALPSASPMPVTRVMSSAPVSRASVFTGLPHRLVPMVENVLDNRLSSSSWRTVVSGMKLWRQVADAEGWSPIIVTDDPERGGKLATFVCHMVENTDLVWGSIESYVWGVRTWMKAQHEVDPTLGIANWAEWMDAVKVLTWVPAEPRRRMPVEVVKLMVEAADQSSFRDVQAIFLILLLLFTFSRSETPCPKAHTGRDAYSADVHLNVQDIDVKPIDDKPALHVRFRRIKQDQRVERPAARGEGDWSIVGDMPGTIFSIIHWYVLLAALHGSARVPDSPFFVDPSDTSRALTYGQALDDVKRRQRDVGVPEDKIAGLHGLRVEGYNGTRDVLGADVAQVHGIWSSPAHNRYARFALSLIASIPSAIVGVLAADGAEDGTASDAPPDTSERAAGPPVHRMTRADASSGAPMAPVPEEELPPDWKSERRTEYADGSGRQLTRPRKVIVSPGGTTFATSVKDAWRRYRGVPASATAPSSASATAPSSPGGSGTTSAGASPSGSAASGMDMSESEPAADVRGQVQVADAVRRSSRLGGPTLPYTVLDYTLSA